MATNYPGSIDSLTNPSAGDALTSPSHSAQHANANDAIEAVQTELGTNPSGSDATVAARLTAIEAGTNLATGAVTSAKIADGTIATGDIADAAVTAAKLGSDVRIGNLLTANQASLETDTTGLHSGFNATVTRDTSVYYQGAASMKAVAVATNMVVFGDSVGIVVTAGETYTAVAMVRAGNAVTIRTKIQWYNSGGTYLSEIAGSYVTANATWVQTSVTAVAPVNAALARVYHETASATAGDAFWADARGLWRGTGGQWAMPGQPILGLTDAPIGNLLSLDQASLENGVSDYSPYANCTLAQHNWGKHGASSLRITSVAAGNASAVLNGDKRVAVTAGDTYTASAFFHSVVSARAASVTVQWYTSANVWISASTGASVTTRTDGTWVQASVTAVAPSTAAYADLIVTIAATGGASEQHTVDCFSIHRGAAGVWSLPGVPVTGQSHIATNGAVHLSGTGSPEGVVTAAPGSTWLQTDATTDVKGWIRWVKATGTGNTGWQADADADTGTRSLAAVSLSNGWAVQYSNLFIHRNGRTVTFGGILNNATATADTVYTVPSGFRPAMHARHIAATADATKFNRVNITSAGALEVWAYNTHAAGTFTYFQVTWLTNDDWPTSLPGSAA